MCYGLTPAASWESSCTKRRRSMPRSKVQRNGKGSTLLARQQGLPRLGGKRRALSPVHWQPDAREAERIRAAKEAELTHGVRILARLPKVRDYLEWYLDWYEAEHPTTISKARSEVKRFIERFGHRPIDSIRAVEVEQYKRARLLDDRAAKETVGRRFDG